MVACKTRENHSNQQKKEISLLMNEHTQTSFLAATAVHSLTGAPRHVAIVQMARMNQQRQQSIKTKQSKRKTHTKSPGSKFSRGKGKAPEQTNGKIRA